MAKLSRNAKRKKRLRERRKAIYVLPNLFTTASLFMGFYSMVATLESRFVEAALAILASLVFDGLDGKIARATKTTSRFGVEYDSLSDLVAFGVAPAVLMYRWALEPFDRFGWLAAFLFVACGALRLARFNVQVEEVGTKHFVGLPIPAAASMISTTVLFAAELGYSGPISFWPLVALMFALSFLMVSNIHYLSFKELGLAKLKSFNWLVALTLCFVLVAMNPQIMGFALLALYVLLGPFGARIMAHKRSASEETKSVGERVTSA